MNSNASVAVGGVGGSGTRVVADLLGKMGFYMGSFLNESLDNLWFTFLFKRPAWYERQRYQPEQINEALGIFKKRMMDDRLSTREQFFIASTVWKRILEAKKIRSSEKISTLRKLYREARGSFRMARSLLGLRRMSDGMNFIGWGWKEPNTHLYLSYLADFIPQLKYIHVIRHGLDMAFSSNEEQYAYWDSQLGGRKVPVFEPTPSNKLRYWIDSNERAIETGKSRLGSRFMILDYDVLCRGPEHGISALLDFLEIKERVKDTSVLHSVVRASQTAGRYKQHDLSVFRKEDIEAVRKFGFEVEDALVR